MCNEANFGILFNQVNIYLKVAMDALGLNHKHLFSALFSLMGQMSGTEGEVEREE